MYYYLLTTHTICIHDRNNSNGVSDDARKNETSNIHPQTWKTYLGTCFPPMTQPPTDQTPTSTFTSGGAIAPVKVEVSRSPRVQLFFHPPLMTLTLLIDHMNIGKTTPVAML